ncbi:FAD-linked oxidase C-terminal domain-containing protein [uncultured Agrococcus sp.]|uniref:FAD-binding oxidoreductase n=1 Tax=uncultured Agrococcus sp. TaxID=382258 RepID=UPI0025F2AAB9|nr:FAD-linked oxidase C-terminal domain-containing protein [uncultured Agrococcus sp.]
MTEAVLEALAEGLSEGALSNDSAELSAARADRSGKIADGMPIAVVHAQSVEDVQHVMRVAHAHGIPVVPRGAGTGLAGAAIAGSNSISLSLLRMNRMLEVNAADQLAVVEPGILNATLNEQLEPHGFWWAPDPASRAISTVGGNIATNAGGLLCAKYGVTREAVLGLDVVLPNGELLHLGHRTVKGVTGYDLAALMIGSEGTLGVVVGATLKLRPLVPGELWTIGAEFPDEQAAAEACAAVTAARIRPAVMELIGSVGIQLLASYTRTTLQGAFVLLQTDDNDGEQTAKAAAEVLERFGAKVELTNDLERSAHLAEARRQMMPAMEAAGNVLVEDVAVPRSRMAEMFAFCNDVGQRYGVTVSTVAHAGDGNLHPAFVFDEAEPTEAVWRAADEIFTKAIDLGGTLTGEHGVGTLKSRWLRDELGDAQYELQRRIKAAFDPAGIMNPGKVFGE